MSDAAAGERGPQPLPPRDLNARLDPAVAPRPQALGLEARRGVGLVAERLAPGLDHEVTVFESRVFDRVGIELELAVPPPVAPGLPHPLRGVERGAVELVVPDE